MGMEQYLSFTNAQNTKNKMFNAKKMGNNTPVADSKG